MQGEVLLARVPAQRHERAIGSEAGQEAAGLLQLAHVLWRGSREDGRQRGAQRQPVGGPKHPAVPAGQVDRGEVQARQCYIIAQGRTSLQPLAGAMQAGSSACGLRRETASHPGSSARQ